MSRRDDIDFEHSLAILVGTSTYHAGFADRQPMPAARNSLTALRQALAGPCEWPSDRIREFHDEHDSGSLLRTISKLTSDVTDVLVFYYVGHGQPIARNGRYDLGLALTDTSEEIAQRALTSLRFRDLREQLAHSTARIKIFILDCCCSGIATEYAESNASVDVASATPLRGAGTYIWTACRHAEETFFEAETDGLTYFTKILTEAIREAPPSGATVAELHDEVKRRLGRTHIPHAQVPPRPDLRFSGQPDQFWFVRGRTAGWQGGEFRFGRLTADDPPTVGPYQLAAPVGGGGMVKLYLAFTAAGQPIAVTVLPPDSGLAERFAHEIDVAWRIRSSHLPQLLDGEPQAVQPWLATEYVCGPTLVELVSETGPLPASDIMRITAGIARALAAIHESGAVHGHLTPANIKVDETGPRVIDTATATALGPVRLTGSPATPASDVLALGGIIGFLATGEEQADLSALDEPIRDLVRQCLASDPQARPTAAQLVETCSTGAGERISSATAAIQARAEALRAITPTPRQPDPNPPPGDQPHVPPPWIQWTHPPASPEPPDHKKKRKARGLAVLAVTALIIALAWSVPGPPAGGNNAGNGGGPVITTETDPFTQEPAPQYVPPSVPTFSPLPTSSSPTQGPVQAAQVGDCFANDGSVSLPALRPAACQEHTFKVIQVVHGTTDRSECPTNSVDDDYNVSAAVADLVLCLEYLPSADAYHAQAGDCVFAPNPTFNSITEQSCQTGNFTVLARLKGTNDTSGCQSYPKTDERPVFTPPWAQLDVVLCLAMNYPDAAGRAQVSRCLYMTGSGSLANFTAVPCVDANVVVTARFPEYDDVADCGADGWTTWQSVDFPQFDYTVCFRSYN